MIYNETAVHDNDALKLFLKAWLSNSESTRNALAAFRAGGLLFRDSGDGSACIRLLSESNAKSELPGGTAALCHLLAAGDLGPHLPTQWLLCLHLPLAS